MKNSVYFLDNKEFKRYEKKFNKTVLGGFYYGLKIVSFIFLLIIATFIWFLIIKDCEMIYNNSFIIILMLVMCSILLLFISNMYIRHFINWYKDYNK